MKTIFLTPGLGAIRRGTERFCLELAAELRKNGMDATCWGTSAMPGVDALPVPGRLQMQSLALDHLRQDSRFAGINPSLFQDWSNYAEDQLFAIPVALRIQELLNQGEQLLVYARWQGGLVDPSGAPTELLKLLASASLAGKARLIVYTDYTYPPIDAKLCSAGAIFHSIGPWLTEQLLRIGIPEAQIVELPMCISASAYRSCHERRTEHRRELGIPQDAFVILSVGSFDTTTPDKRHVHVLREIFSLPGHDRIYWVVAGSRGAVTYPGAWWEQAKREMGARFVPFTNLAFEQMPSLYGLADLFALASLNETFGLVYLEAQFAGLPVLIHNGQIQQHFCSHLPPNQAALSLVDMRRAGPAANAIRRWMGILSDAHQQAALRTQLDQFALNQAKRFAWEYLGSRYADEFRRIAGTLGKQQSGARTPALLTPDQQNHQFGLRLFKEERYTDALRLIAQSLSGRETSERWNDWAVVQSAMQEWDEAEEGFRHALELDPKNSDATLNLAVLLHSRKRSAEALPLFAAVQGRISTEQAARAGALLEECKKLATTDSGSARAPAPVFMREAANTYETACLQALTEMIPDRGKKQRLLVLGTTEECFAKELAQTKDYELHCIKDAGALEYPDGCFDLVAGSSWLEGLACDPIASLREIHRVLAPEGMLFLTVANIASLNGIQSLLRASTPYVSGRYPPGSRDVSRHHNREYTADELATLLKSAGFDLADLRTRNLRWKCSPGLSGLLAGGGYPVAFRGDTLMVQARKSPAVHLRFPSMLYDLRKAPKHDVDAVLRSENREHLRILVVHEQFPRFDRGGADLRLTQIVRALRQMEHDVTYLAVRGWDAHKYAPPLKAMGVRCYGDDAAAVRYEGLAFLERWSLEDVLDEGQFDIAVLFQWFWMCISIPENCIDEIRRLSPETRIAVLTDDRHGHREMQRARLSGLFSDGERARNFEDREREIYSAADCVISITEDDRREIRRLSGKTPVELLPMAAQTGAPGGDFDSRAGVVFLADYNNPANLDGLNWFLNQVWPGVRERIADIKLYLVGSQMPPRLAEGYADVERVGYVPDLAVELAKYRVFVSPIRFGTGIKTKNLSAMAHGLPLVTTRCGAEGMKIVNEQHSLIADSASDFGDAIVRAYNERILWQQLATRGREHISEHFSEQRLTEALSRTLNSVQKSTAKPHDPGHSFSIRLVEKHFPEVLAHQPPADRPSLRLLAYAKLAEQLIASGRKDEAARQIRHIFSFVPTRIPYDTFFAAFGNVIDGMDRSYRALGKSDAATALRKQSDSTLGISSLPSTNQAVTQSQRKSTHKAKSDRTSVSVIIPTFSRCSKLRACLDALERQRTRHRNFEAVVIDDGSEDDTATFCKKAKYSFSVRYLRQGNRGAGAARCLGVENARGELLLLINDDTIADPSLIAEHLRAHQQHKSQKIAVLGDFTYPPECRRRALTWFLSRSPLLFPQVELQPGLHDKNAYFICCNLSIAKSAAIATGSFDPQFRVAEDTELGIRLRAAGYRVMYEPRAKALHDHLGFTIHDFIQRARTYGRTQVLLFRKHPHLIGDGTGSFGNLDEGAIQGIRKRIDRNRHDVLETVKALEKFDAIDFSRLADATNGNGAGDIMQLFARAVPEVFWHFLFESFLDAWNHSNLPHDLTSSVPESTHA